MFQWTKREAPMWRSLRNLPFKPGGIIDIGANVGDWARQAHAIFDCPIHMIKRNRH